MFNFRIDGFKVAELKHSIIELEKRITVMEEFDEYVLKILESILTAMEKKLEEEENDRI